MILKRSDALLGSTDAMSERNIPRAGMEYELARFSGVMLETAKHDSGEW